ncbi:hypothetical protein HDU67_007937 [Dinochytrium kinnereticum]|nr:hypothetical protein HDU67_007937 [Dinochytrium kinnereticum]
MLKGVASTDIPKHVQCVVPQTSLPTLLDQIKENPPRLLIGTPRRILDLLDENAIDISRLQTVVLDEVDHLVRVKKRFETVKEKANREKHPLYAELLVDRIVLARRTLEELKGGIAPNATVLQAMSSKGDGGKAKSKPAAFSQNPAASLNRLNRFNAGPESRRLQVVICSATINNAVRKELERMRGWLVDPLLIDEQGRHMSPPTISHHCLIVDPVSKFPRNILTHAQEDEMKMKTLKEAVDGQGKPIWLKRREEPALADDDDAILEVVARVVQTMKIQRGILFLNSTISVARVTERLRALGVKAGRVQDEVDFSSASNVSVSEDEAPSSFFSGTNDLLVVGEFTARGLDLPDVTHVIMLGPPSSPASYLHMSGRVGRFGRHGTAVTLLGGARFEGKMLDMWRLLQVDPAPIAEGFVEG